MQQKQNYVFISYSSKNRTMADAFRHLLTSENIASWMAPYDIPAGSNYATEITDALQNSSCLVFLMTPESVDSPFVERELDRALSYRKTIIPLQLSPTNLTSSFEFFLSLAQIISVPCIDRNDPALKNALETIRLSLNQPVLPVSSGEVLRRRNISLKKLRCFTSNAQGEEAFRISSDEESADISVDYASAGSPDYGGLFLRFGRGLDLQPYRKISFDLECTGLKRIRFEVKPYSGSHMHESFPITPDSSSKRISVDISDFEDSRNLVAGEFAWAIYRVDFADPQNQTAAVRIRDIRVD